MSVAVLNSQGKKVGGFPSKDLPAVLARLETHDSGDGRHVVDKELTCLIRGEYFVFRKGYSLSESHAQHKKTVAPSHLSP